MLYNNLMSLKHEAAPHFLCLSVCRGLWFCFLRLCFELWVRARHVLPMTEKTSRLREMKSIAGTMVFTQLMFSHSVSGISPSLTVVAEAATSAKSVTREGRNGMPSTAYWTSTGLISFLAAGLCNFSSKYVVTSGWSVGTWVWYRSDGRGKMLMLATSGILEKRWMMEVNSCAYIHETGIMSYRWKTIGLSDSWRQQSRCCNPEELGEMRLNSTKQKDALM